ncbi:hydroxyproline-rich glycoprotein-like [Panicum miliaceum]|uniref:Hydroxyproline-rich glycoprotein-like n=1 Tax=Panicum miliaceum TaxID=4540 RepID=A0A3L6RJR1_PANMI|nr:hydroxyproline-rich glycoprotein-like [Panicum miliaceum]
MALQHDVLERCAFARASIRNHLRSTGHSLEFCPEERLGLVSGRIHHCIKKAFDCLTLCNARRKFERELDVDLHGTDDDRKLMARRNARHEASGMAEIDRSVSRTFKKNLNKDYVKKGLTPNFEKEFKNQCAFWDEFVHYKLSDDSERRTEQAKTNARKKIHFHHLGQGGYSPAIPKWQKMEEDLIAKGITPATFNWPL